MPVEMGGEMSVWVNFPGKMSEGNMSRGEMSYTRAVGSWLPLITVQCAFNQRCVYLDAEVSA